MTTPEAETIDELIADCAELPPALSASANTVVPPCGTGDWTVTEACARQVSDLDEYV